MADSKNEKKAAKKTAKKATKKDAAKKVAGSSTLKALEYLEKSGLKQDDLVVNLDPDTLKESLPHISTGSFVLNNLIGGRPNTFGIPPCPGWPRGKIVNVYGPASCGKTTLALHAAAQVGSINGSCCYLDWENEVAPDYSATLGVQITNKQRFVLVQPNTMEDGFRVMWTMAACGTDLIVVDSVAAGVPEIIFNQKIGEIGADQKIGIIATKWSQFLPKFKRLIARTGTCVIGISQTRKTINLNNPGQGDTVQGGEAWKFYTSLRVKLARIKQEKSKQHNVLKNTVEDRYYGGVIRARLDKCKVSSAQSQEADFFIRYGSGIDDYRSVIEIASAHGIIKKASSWFTYTAADGEEHRYNGAENFRAALIGNPGLFTELVAQTTPMLAGTKLAVGPEEEAEDIDDIEDIIAGMKDDVPGEVTAESTE